MQDNKNSNFQGLSYPRQLVGKSLLLANAQWRPDDSWHVVDYSRTIGRGEDDFARAVDNLLSWRAHRAACVRVKGEPEPGETVQLYFGPTVSPCRIISVKRSPRRVDLIYGTMHGHIECGEEAFIIELDSDDEVIGAVLPSHSIRGGWPGFLADRHASSSDGRRNVMYVVWVVIWRMW